MDRFVRKDATFSIIFFFLIQNWTELGNEPSWGTGTSYGTGPSCEYTTLQQTQRQNRASGASDTHYPAHFDLSAISILIRCPIWNLRRIQCTIMSFISICHPHHVRSPNKIADALVCGLFVDALYEVPSLGPCKVLPSIFLFSSERRPKRFVL